MTNTRISIREFAIPATYALENKVLGVLVGNPSYITEARKVLGPASFSDDKNAAVWNRLCTLDDAGEPIDAARMYRDTDQEHFSKNILPYINTTDGPLEMAAAVDDLGAVTARRRTYFTACDLLRLASGNGTPEQLEGVLAEYQRELEAMQRKDHTVSVKEAVNDLAQILENRQADAAAGRPLRVPTSFPSLDFLTYGGFARGNLVILAARPSVGKTALMLQAARAAAVNKIPAVVYSLEMTNPELVQRMVCATTKMNNWQMNQGKIDWTAFNVATGQFSNLPLWFNDQVSTFNDIVASITQAHKKGRCEIAFIDYLGLIAFEGGRSLYEQVTVCTKRLKKLAKDLHIPIVLLCQLNRDMSREGRAPELHDLRDSGSIEQDADIVLMLDRDMSTAEMKDVRMFVRKNRQGRVGDCIVLRPDETFTNFCELGHTNFPKPTTTTTEQ